MTVLHDLAAFAAGASVASLGEAERTIQRHHLVDTVAAAIAGRTTADGRALCGVLADRPMGLRAATVRLTEIDDIHCASCTTPSSAIVPSVLTLIARHRRADPAALADALWVGTEIIARLGAAIRGPWILYRGVWPTYFCAPMGVAAAIGRLLGLDASAMTNALAIALNLAAGAVGVRDKPRSPRWLLFATAVEAGHFAARAAADGYGGDPGLLDGPDWLRDTHGLAFDPSVLTDGLGARAVHAELSLKPYCSAKQAIAAIDAFRNLLADGVDPASVDAIDVRVPPEYAAMISRAAAPNVRASTMVSVAYQLALAAFRPEKLYDVARETAPFDKPIVDLVAKTKVVAAGDLSASFPARYPAAVIVEAKGRRYERRVVEAEGDPDRALDDLSLAAKLHRMLDPLIGEEETDDWIEAGSAALVDAASARALSERFARLFEGTN
jgi:2-methylcitrate dehydratase PrpD